MMKLFTKNKKKKDNKGFSLVELIVVIAIMAILAVALAPRLFHYLDKARKSNDNNLINTIGTAVQNALVEENIYKDADVAALKSTGSAEKWFVLASGTGKELTYATTPKLLVDEITKIASGSATKCKLQSDDAESGTNYILVKFENQSDFQVRLYYNAGTNITVTGGIATISAGATLAYEATASR